MLKQLYFGIIRRTRGIYFSFTINANSFGTNYIRNGKIKEDIKPKEWENAKPYEEIPGPKSWPVVGSDLNFILFGKYAKIPFVEKQAQLFKDFGPVFKLKGSFGNPDVVFSSNPEDIEMVYRTDGQWPRRIASEITFLHFQEHKRPDIYKGYGGLLYVQGEEWKKRRSKLNTAMMQPRTIKQYTKPLEEIADDFISRIERIRDSKHEMPKDFENELHKWALESICLFSMDTRLGFLQDHVKPDTEVHRLIESTKQYYELSFQLEVLTSLWKYISTPGYRQVMKALDIITNVSVKYVDAAIKRLNNHPKKPADDESVLEKLIKINRQVAIVITVDNIIAGTESAASTTGSLLYFLATNQSKQNKLREEIKTVLPKLESRLNPDFINSVPYLKACMKESSRLVPIFISNNRTAGRDVVFSGYQIPKGTEVVLSHMTAQKDGSQFSKPDKFIPERWITGRKSSTVTGYNKCPASHEEDVPSAKEAHPFCLMPFGFGPRMCIGKRIAELEVAVFISKFIRNYRVEWNYGEMEIINISNNKIKNPLQFKVTKLGE